MGTAPRKVYLDDVRTIFAELSLVLLDTARIQRLLDEYAEKLEAAATVEDDDDPGGVPV